ncbi:MAG: hypothetical protein EOP50_08205 [Sphingobacteriales bacterium]|nr:MAG: hypothetical protein EOP50_08205 [Sphingobacteriales bacterium]
MDYESAAAKWTMPESVEWGLVRNALADHLQETVATFAIKNPKRVVYGIVVVHGQNWELSVYLNTEEGYASMPDRFRRENPTYAAKSDADLLTSLGRWYYHAWEFQLYEFQCRPEVNAVNHLHLRIFQQLYDQAIDQKREASIDILSERFLSTCADATAMLERNPVIMGLLRTKDFQIRFYDGNRYEWDTDSIMKKARENIADAQSRCSEPLAHSRWLLSHHLRPAVTAPASSVANLGTLIHSKYMHHKLRGTVLVIAAIAALLYGVRWFAWAPARQMERTARTMIGRPEAELTKALGEPKHIVFSDKLAGQTVDYPWKDMNYLPVPDHPVRNKVLLYSIMNVAIYVYVDEHGLIEHVARAAT